MLAAVTPVAQQWTGVDCILFYVPFMLSSFGAGDKVGAAVYVCGSTGAAACE